MLKIRHLSGCDAPGIEALLHFGFEGRFRGNRPDTPNNHVSGLIKSASGRG